MLSKEVLDPRIHLPKYYRGVKEIECYSEAISKVLENLAAELLKMLDNRFVLSADEDGILRFEKMLGINSNIEDSLATRKKSILNLSTSNFFTWKVLEQKVSEYSKEYSLELVETWHSNHTAQHLTVNVGITEKGAEESLYRLLYTMLPANISFEIVNEARVSIDFDIYVAMMPDTRGD